MLAAPANLRHDSAMRVLRLFLILAVLLCLPFIVWGDRFEAWFTGDAAVQWLRQYGAWGWVAGIGLLISDLILPVPATAVISALGYLYGVAMGGTIGAVGSLLSGVAAYGLCRWIGPGMARRLAGGADLNRYEAVFRRSGWWLVALSRWLPLLPEVVACLAGLSRMKSRTFLASLACGSVPLGFVYAAIGAAGQDRPALALTLSAVLPAALILAGKKWLAPATAAEDPAAERPSEK